VAGASLDSGIREVLAKRQSQSQLTQEMGHMTNSLSLQVLDLVSCHRFQQHMSMGLPLKTAHIAFFTASG